MEPDSSPFDILGISPLAELVVINAAYKALARRYHPDMNPGVPAAELNRKMSELNWAKEELERDLEGWRARIRVAEEEGAARPDSGSGSTRQRPPGEGASVPRSGAPSGVVRAEPEVVALAGRRGSTASFTASAAGLPPSQIRARFKQGCIEVQRLEGKGDSALFAVKVVEDFASDLPDNAIEIVEVIAPGFVGSKVFVSIAPVSQAILSQQYGTRIAPPRHASPESRISFGKHRGRKFQEIAVEEPGYLDWMLREGAGSRIERECARMALDRLRGGKWLPQDERRPRYAVRPGRAARPARALPDPNRPGGIWAAVKALFSSKQRNS
jgi:hypothetical protein